MRALLSRMRASAGPLALLTVLAAAAAALLVGGPRYANGQTDAALRQSLDSLGYQIRDVSYQLTTNRRVDAEPNSADTQLGRLSGGLDSPLRDVIGRSWWSTQLEPAPVGVTGSGFHAKAQFGIRMVTGWQNAVTVVAGRLPDTTDRASGFGKPQVIEVVVSRRTAELFSKACGEDCTFGLGTQFHVPGPETTGGPGFRAVVVGVVEPAAADPTWEPEPLVVEGQIPIEDGDPYIAVFLTDQQGAQNLATHAMTLDYEWRFRVDAVAVDYRLVPRLRDAVADARDNRSYTAQTGLDVALLRFTERVRASQALLGIVPAGVLVILVGLVLLASRLAVQRRVTELVLLRGRGASLADLARHTAAETAVVIPAGALAGAIAATAVPGRPGTYTAVLVLFTAVAVLAIPAFAMTTGRRPAVGGEREDLATGRVGPRRRTAELSLLALAGLGIWLLRRRGLAASDDVDVFLVTVPALLAATAAITMLRALPSPLAWSGRLAGRSRGAVAFLGLARSGRSAPAVIGPIAVLVVAVSTAVFSISVATTVEQGRDEAAAADTVGDMVVLGKSFDRSTTAALAAVPGVSVVSPFLSQPETRPLVGPDRTQIGQVLLLAVDGPSLAGAAETAGRPVPLPSEIVDGRPAADGSAPVLVSSAVAERLAEAAGRDAVGATFSVSIRGVDSPLTVAGVVDGFPTLNRSAVNFIVVPWQALPVLPQRPLHPNGFVISGSPDPDAVDEVLQDGYRTWLAGVGVDSDGARTDLWTVTYAERRGAMAADGMNGVLSFTYQLGAYGGVVFALIAVGFTVLAGARQRGTVLSRLRTLGLSRGQGRRLLLVELTPLITIGVLTGVAVGVALPRLLGPVLGLTAFTDGYDPGTRLNPSVVAGAAGLIVAGLLTAIVVENVFNRRRRLGEALRLGTAE